MKTEKVIFSSGEDLQLSEQRLTQCLNCAGGARHNKWNNKENEVECKWKV